MSRPFITLTPAQMAEVETLAAVLTTEQIADFFGIGRRTFYSLMERDEDIAARYKRGKARAIGSIAQTLISKARAGDTASMIFYLKTQGGWRETQVVEVTTAEEAQITSDQAMEAMCRHLDQIAARISSGSDGGEMVTLTAETQRVIVDRDG